MIKKKTSVNPVIKDDIQRYTKNKLGSMLALLSIVFCCAYFIVLYAQVKNGNYYYKWPIALDVIYNLFFLLFAFLFSEQIKNYDRKMFWAQLAFGVMQVVRIFWLPLAGVSETVYSKLADMPYTGKVLGSGAFICMVIFLAASGACLIASAVIGYIRSKSLEDFNKKVESGEVSVDAVLKELNDKEQAASASEIAEEVTNA